MKARASRSAAKPSGLLVAGKVLRMHMLVRPFAMRPVEGQQFVLAKSIRPSHLSRQSVGKADSQLLRVVGGVNGPFARVGGF